MAEISPLRRRMIEDMTVRNLSPATQQSYLNAVSKFSRYFGRSPDRLSLEDVHAFQLHLVATGISWPALNQIVCALRFFYGVTLGQAIVPERIAHAREPSKLPVVLSADEVVRFLEAIPSLKSRTALTTVYAAGLRVSESRANATTRLRRALGPAPHLTCTSSGTSAPSDNHGAHSRCLAMVAEAIRRPARDDVPFGFQKGRTPPSGREARRCKAANGCVRNTKRGYQHDHLSLVDQAKLAE